MCRCFEDVTPRLTNSFVYFSIFCILVALLVDCMLQEQCWLDSVSSLDSLLLLVPICLV